MSIRSNLKRLVTLMLCACLLSALTSCLYDPDDDGELDFDSTFYDTYFVEEKSEEIRTGEHIAMENVAFSYFGNNFTDFRIDFRSRFLGIGAFGMSVFHTHEHGLVGIVGN